MGILSGASDFFGLDIGTSAVRVVQLRGGRQKSLMHYGSKPIDVKVSQSDAPADQQKVAQIVREVIIEAGISTTNVAVGIPSSKVFSAVVDMDRLSHDELAKTIRYQADALIPTPLAESKIDWALLGDSPKEPSKVEVLLSSVSNDFIEKRLDMLESIGLNVIAFEPDSLAVTRALLAEDHVAPTLLVDMGDISSDLIMVLNGVPRLMRTIPVGNESIVKAATQNLSIDEKQATQFVYKFGLSRDKLEGQIYNAIIGSVDVLVSEIEKSIKFFQARYNNTKIDRIIVTGGASTLPELPLYIANKFAVTVEIGNAWRNVLFGQERQNELMTMSHQFSVAAGLAERNE
ncbi:MAG: type IV pilus assembly protein PilM [bacterium]|nr:type IV pilus assembly protein PilM [bacterium]